MTKKPQIIPVTSIAMASSSAFMLRFRRSSAASSMVGSGQMPSRQRAGSRTIKTDCGQGERDKNCGSH